MSDVRVKAAQDLFWQIEALRALGAPHSAIVSRLDEMARLHEERARELLGQQNVDGWTDLFAAITALGEAGSELRATRLLRWGEQEAHQVDGGQTTVRNHPF